MQHRRLGERLRALILATPLIAAPACSKAPPVDMSGCRMEEIALGDSGINPDAGAPDNWDACLAACQQLGFYDAVGPCMFETVAGVPSVYCHDCNVEGGRRPAALLPSSSARRSSPLGAYFAEMARLEAASVPAFRILARELEMHRAPKQLPESAWRSSRDEVRHARATAALARRYGAEPIRPSFGPTPSVRSLEAIAIENAVEGCARETHGALVALWQARHARDPAVAAAMGPIAADEIRHAELAWEVAAWAEPRLSRAARGRVGIAKAEALADLAHRATRDVAPSLVALAGVPSPTNAAALLNDLLFTNARPNSSAFQRIH